MKSGYYDPIEDRSEEPFVEETEESRRQRIIAEAREIVGRRTMLLPEREHLEALLERVNELEGQVAEHKRQNLIRAGWKDAA